MPRFCWNAQDSREPLPRWLKRNVPKGNANHFTAQLIGEMGLQTVCDHAKCPNRMECFARKTATFMILGDVCTRGCRFCGVKKGRPRPPDADEPRRIAEAVRTLGLRHIVITCVTRDDLPDGGAEHFVRTIEAVREPKGDGPFFAASCHKNWDSSQSSLSPFSPTIEVLPSDFAGNIEAVDRLIAASPNVYNHNVETVPRLFAEVRRGCVIHSHADQRARTVSRNGHSGAMYKKRLSPFPPTYPNYAWTLEMFRHIRRANPAIQLKTGLMLGLGETTDELLDTLADLLEAGCRLLTLGQYLQPGPTNIPVARYVPPEEFEQLGRLALRMGFERVASGPFVRSSYRAEEMAAR